MATSENEHYVPFDATLIETEDFADTGLERRVLGNLDHLADQRAQNLINWSTGGYADAYEASPVADIYYEVWRSTKFDLSMRSDGTPYACRAECLVTSNSGTYEATFALVLAHADANPVSEANVGASNVAEVTVTSSSYQRKTPASLLQLSVDQARRAQSTIPSLASLGGEELPAIVTEARLYVVAKVENASAAARLRGVQLTEYVEPSS